jgi:mannose-1-phosphate guanylyltransferase
MKAIILVGGEGTRLRPLTLDTPKPLMPVANRPFLSHVLANLARHGVQEAILTTGYRAEAFDAFPLEERHDVKLTVVQEASPLDTAGAVKNVESLIDSTFVVLNGDILTDLDLSALVAFHREHRAAGTLTLTPVQDPSAYGLVPLQPDGRIERFVEKPRADEIVTNLVNAGTYVLEADLLKRIPAGQPYSFERELFPDLLSDLAPMYGYRSNAYWLDLGTPPKYLHANMDVLEGKAGERPPGRTTPSGAWVGEGSRIDPSVRVRGPVAMGESCRVDLAAVIYPRTCLGARCHIGEAATIEGSVLHDDVEIEPGATVEGSILGRGVKVGSRTRIVDAVVGAGVDVGADNELRAGVRIWPGIEIPDHTITF